MYNCLIVAIQTIIIYPLLSPLFIYRVYPLSFSFAAVAHLGIIFPCFHRLIIYPPFSQSDDNLHFLSVMIYPSFSPSDDLSLSFAAAATAPTQRDPNAEGQSIT